MRFVVASIDTFKIIFQNLKTFADDLVIRFGPQGLYVQGMDPSMSCCFELKLPVGWFKEYNDAHEDFGIGLSSGVLQKVLSVHHPSQTITFSVTAQSDVLEVSFTGGKEGIFDSFFEIPLMVIEQDLFQFEPYESEIDLTLHSERLSGLVNQLKMFDDRVRLHFTDQAVVVEAKGVEAMMRSDITAEHVLEYAIGEGVVFEQEYSLEFLGMLCIFKKLNAEFMVKFHRERPMEGIYCLEQKKAHDPQENTSAEDKTAEDKPSEDQAFLKFFLAPKLGTNDDI